MKIPSALTIAGSDSGCGAGLQADLKTFTTLGVYGMTAVTSITVQNTVGVFGVVDVPPEVVYNQIKVVVEDIGVDAVKTGMLSHAGIIEAVARAVKDFKLENLVVDPVMRAKSGDPLLKSSDEVALKGLLIPLATIITPNIPEACALVGKDIKTLEVLHKDKPLGRVMLGVPGRHNVYNALACISVCLEMDIPPKVIFEALEGFKNAERRLELKGEIKGCLVYDDYGHHPTEIRAVLSSLRELYPQKEVVLVFQPHRYSRTYYLFNEFAEVLKSADRCILTDIYSAGEENLWGVRAEDLAQKSGAIYLPTKEEVFSYLEENLRDCVLVFMGAGSIGRWAEEFLNERVVG